MRRTLSWVGALTGALALLVAILVVNALRTAAGGEAFAPVAPRPVDVERVAAVLAGAIRIATVSADPGGPPRAALAALEAHLASAFPRVFALPIERPADGTLLIAWAGSDAGLPPMLLMAHQDVVPVVPGTEAAWQRPPFAGEIDEEFVWGRGAMDDKGSLVTLLTAAEALLAEGFAPKRTVLLAFGHDEEVQGSGAAAVARTLRERGVRPALVLDEGMTILAGRVAGVAAPIAFVGVTEKGYATFELIAEAQGGHSSMPGRESAITLLSAALARLTAEPLPARRDAPVFAMLARLAPHASFGMRLVYANPWLFRPLVAREMTKAPMSDALLRTTLAPTIVEGGVKENVIPPRARAVVNLRLLPGDTVAATARELARRVADARVAIRALPTPDEASTVSADSGWGYAVLERSTREVRPDVVVAPGLMLGATDARHFAALSDQVFRYFPIEMGEGDLERYHGTDERISKRNLEQAVRVYARVIENGSQ